MIHPVVSPPHAHMPIVHTYYLSNTYLIKNNCFGRPVAMGSYVAKLPHMWGKHLVLRMKY